MQKKTECGIEYLNAIKVSVTGNGCETKTHIIFG